MLSPDTIESARSWYETGVSRLGNESASLALTYLDRAIPVFAEAGDLRRATLARHYRLLACKIEERFEEAEGLFVQVMQGYTELDDSYGQALLLSHLAEAQAAQGRWQRAHSLFNLTCAVAENDGHRDLVAYVLLQQGHLCRERDDLVRAIKLFQRAERLVEREEPPDRLAQFRFLRAQTLSQLGETAEAIAVLEDVQSHYVRTKQSQAAVEPLALLRKLYEDEGQDDGRDRVSQLLHLSGQRMIQTDALPRPRAHLGPPIDREL